MDEHIGADPRTGKFRVDLRTRDSRQRSINAMVADSAKHHDSVTGAIGCILTGIARTLIVEAVRSQHQMTDDEAVILGNALADTILMDGSVNVNTAQMLGDLAYLYDDALARNTVPIEVALAYSHGRHDC